MSKKIKRRDFLRGGAAAGLALTAKDKLFGRAPAVIIQGVRPAVVSSANGNQFKNGGDETCVQKAFRLMTAGTDVLDALIAGVNILELDPTEDSVGYGGLPNAEGVVQLDSSCMHGPRKRAGAVAALEGVRTPSLVAKAVLEQTHHHPLGGQGGQEIAPNFWVT